jgi:hypothetical protein
MTAWVKDVADQADMALDCGTAAAVIGDDAGGFLAAMLEGVQAERGDSGGLGMAKDAEHAANAFTGQQSAYMGNAAGCSSRRATGDQLFAG